MSKHFYDKPLKNNMILTSVITCLARLIKTSSMPFKAVDKKENFDENIQMKKSFLNKVNTRFLTSIL